MKQPEALCLRVIKGRKFCAKESGFKDFKIYRVDLSRLQISILRKHSVRTRSSVEKKRCKAWELEVPMATNNHQAMVEFSCS